MAESLDINKLSLTLSSITDIDNEKRIESEQIISKSKALPKFGPLLLNIACNKNNQFQETVSLQAAIQLKNYIRSYWKYGPNETINLSLRFEDEEIIIISDEDKNYLKDLYILLKKRIFKY